MSSNINDLQQQLELHRTTLSHYLKQQAIFGSAFTPPHVVHGIREAREHIRRIKQALRDMGVSVEDHPDDGLDNLQLSSTDKTTKVTILFLAADPSDTARLRLGQELRDIQEKLQLAHLRDRFVLHQRMSVRPEDLSQALLDTRPQIVHFSGHGTAGALYFEDKAGNSHPIDADALAALFEQFADQVRCVVLNACYSKTQADAIAMHVPYVIGMDEAIGDDAAIAFAVGFYQALGAGRSFEEAYKLGCVQIRLQGIPEHLTPVMTKKS